MHITIGNITGEVVRAAGSRKEKEDRAATRKNKRNSSVRTEREKIRQHGYKGDDLTKAVANAEKRLDTLRLELSELDAKSIQLEDLAIRTGKIQPSARNVEFDRVHMRPLIARAIQDIAAAQAALDAHNSEAAASEIIGDHDAETIPDAAHVDAPRRGRPPKVLA